MFIGSVHILIAMSFATIPSLIDESKGSVASAFHDSHFDPLCCFMAVVRYEKTRHLNIYKQCRLFVGQLGQHPNVLRFRHKDLKQVIAWRDKVKAWMTGSRKIRRERCHMEVDKEQDTETSSVHQDDVLG